MADTQPAMTYPTEEQYERWKEQASEMDMSVSEFMQAMIEAGMKKFDASVEPDETVHELRKQRSDLKRELEQARIRVANLEERLYHGEQETIQRFVEENPGATYGEIVQHVIDTVPNRVSEHLDMMEGDTLRFEDDQYYPAEGDGDA